jgi:hypothetical protein
MGVSEEGESISQRIESDTEAPNNSSVQQPGYYSGKLEIFGEHRV